MPHKRLPVLLICICIYSDFSEHDFETLGSKRAQQERKIHIHMRRTGSRFRGIPRPVFSILGPQRERRWVCSVVGTRPPPVAQMMWVALGILSVR